MASKNNISPSYVVGSFTSNRFVIGQLSKRAIQSRYRGTLLGVLWSLITPLLMLGIYTFVFGTVLEVRWEDQGGGNLEFASILFSGMLIHGIFAECLTRAPTLINANPQYVKKIVFPLEALCWVTLSTAFFQGMISGCILGIYVAITQGSIPWTIIFFPLPLIGLAFFCVGVGWMLSSTAVFVRDIAQVVGLLSTVLFFLAPILYPKSALPEMLQDILYLNPITFPIEQFRDFVLWGEFPDWSGLLIYTAAGYVFAWLSLVWFQRARRGFADVI